MFKKFFVTIICCMLLWELFSNTTGELTKFTLPDTKESSEFQTENNDENHAQKPEFQKDFSETWYPLADYEAQKDIINKQAQEILKKAEEIRISINNNALRNQ